MPNYVKNIVEMAEIADLPLFQEEDGKKFFDFNTLIPMPEELNLDAGAPEMVSIRAVLNKIRKFGIGRFVDIGIDEKYVNEERLIEYANFRGMAFSDLEREGLKYIRNLVYFGYSSWFDWRCQYWGTKWNAMETEIIDEDTISFWTAWNNPSPIIAELGKRYPDREIEHWWADEDIGYNSGHRLVYGDMIDDFFCDELSQDAFETYVKCWGENSSLVRDESGLLHFVDNYFDVEEGS